jgi:hypothetical protein
LTRPTGRSSDRDTATAEETAGWGCLTTVPVFLEYAEPRRPPEVALFEMCDKLDTPASPASRP